MWWKIIIVGLTGNKPNYKLFCSEDNSATKIIPIEKTEYRHAYNTAQKISSNYKIQHKLIDEPRILIFEVPQPMHASEAEFKKVVRQVLADYMDNGFIELLIGVYWQKAVEAALPDRREVLGSSVFMSQLDKNCSGWTDFTTKFSSRMDEINNAAKEFFLERYREHREAIIDSYGIATAQS